ncbi:MAG: SAM-dependent methyltransferase [Desulfobacteraceae bacterium 4572_89]|nr:MAG: SAM-dependent methyltransferase [Desulfobacteraceae bacterium 4572_89]
MDWNPGTLLEMSGYYWKTCTLHAGVKLDIFTIIGSSTLSRGKIAEKLGMDERGVTMLLNALAAMELLVKKKDTYTNTTEALTFLSKDSKQYIGFMILHHHHLAQSWVNMDQAIRQGSPIRQTASHSEEEEKAPIHQPAPVAEPAPVSEEERRESFLMGMFNIGMATAPGLAKDLDLSQCTRLLDLGGGPGTFAIHFCLNNPGLAAEICDLPTTRPFAEKTIEQFKVSDQVSFTPGDYTRKDFCLDQKFDAAWLSHILHGEGPEMAEKIIARAISALRPGGKIFIHEFILDNTMDGPLFPALFSLNMFLGTQKGQSYTEKQLIDMLTAQGVVDIARLDFKGPTESGILAGKIK